MADKIPIHIFSIAFGTRKRITASSTGAVGQEVIFYSDGRTDEMFANLNDIYNQAQQISFLSAGKSAYEGMDDMASFTGSAYKTSMGTLYYYIRRAMHTNVGRASSYGQIVIYKKEDLTGQNSFIKNVLGFHFLTEDQITGMEEYPLSRREVELADEVPPVDLRTLPEARRNSLCRAAELLLTGKKVMIRLSEGEKFVSQCRQALVELFTLLPEAVRSDISFSTCRKNGDFHHAGSIQLLIVDKNVVQDSRYELIEMDAGGNPVSDCMQKWCMDSTESRSQINDWLTEGEETLQSCYNFLKQYYDPAEKWWITDNPLKRFTAYDDIVEYMKKSLLFCTGSNWEAFCSQIPKLVSYEGETGEDAVQEMMLDEYFWNRSKGDKWLEFAGNCKFRNGLYKLGLSDEKFKEVQEAVVITKETLKRVDELQKKYAADTMAQQEQFEMTLQTQQKQFETTLQTQQKQFDKTIQEQQTKHAEYAAFMREQQAKYSADAKAQEERFNSALQEQQAKHTEDTKAQKEQFDFTLQNLESKYATDAKAQEERFNFALQEQQAKYAENTIILKNQFDSTLQNLESKHATDAKAQEERFNLALQEQQRKYAEHTAAVQEQQAKYAADVKAQKEQFDSTLQNLESKYATDTKAQEERFNSVLREQRTQHDSDYQKLQTKCEQDANIQKNQLETALNEFTKTLSAQKDAMDQQKKAMDRQSETLEEINRRLGEIESGSKKTNDRIDSMTTAMDENQASQESSLQKVQKRLEKRMAEISDDSLLMKQAMEKKQEAQQEKIDKLAKSINNIKRSEGGGGNQTAMIAAIAAVCLAVILLVVFVIMAVKYVPVIKEAEIELKATPAPTAEPIYITAEPTEAPTPESSLEPTEAPSLEPTETPAFTPVPDELQKYLAVCAEYELLLAQDKCGDGRWVYENDWASVEICLNTDVDAADIEAVPTDTQEAEAEVEGVETEDENVVTIVSSAYTLTVRKLEPALEEGVEAEDKAAEIEAKFKSLVEKLQEVCLEAMTTSAPTAEDALAPESEEEPAASSGI